VTAAAVILLCALIAVCGFWAATLVELRDERRHRHQRDREQAETERQRVARRRRLGLPAEDDL